MRIGLLVCDHVRDAHLDIDGDYEAMFADLFGHRDDVNLVAYDVIDGEMPEDPLECDAWMTTGSRHSVNDDEQWIRDLESFVREVSDAAVPFVGICFGHQLLASSLGGTVVKSDRGWGIGIKEVEVSPGLEWTGGKRSFRVTNCHQDQVETLPRGAKVLGWNDHCPVSVMSVGNTMLGIQGHPEMTPEYARALIELRIGGAISDEVARAGLESLSSEPDMAMLADWIVAFIKSASPANV